MIKIAICDDEKKELETIHTLLMSASQEVGAVCRCSLFDSGEKLLDEVEREHAVDAFALEALHYLVKPVDAGQLQTVLERYLKRAARKRTVEIRIGRDNIRLSEESIQYLESARNGTDIHTAGGLLHTAMPTGALEQKLGQDFLKIQRGFIVNMHYIEKMTSEFCILKNGFTALLSRRDRQKIRTAYREFIFNVAEGSEDT